MAKTLHSWIITLFLIFGFCLNGFSQQNWELLSPLPTYKTGRSVQFVSKDTGFIITETELLETLDSGGTWRKKQNITSGRDLKFNGSTGFIVGDYGSVLKSIDSGNSWDIVNTGLTENFNTVTIVDSNTILISSENGLIKSLDGGKSWTRNVITKGKVVKTFFTSGLVGHAACKNGTMLKTIDGGVTWYTTRTSNVTPSNFFTVYFVNENIGFASGEHSYLYRTADGGETWEEIAEDDADINAIYSFYFLNEKVGFCVGESPIVYKTVDGGLTWQYARPNDNIPYIVSIRDLFFTDENIGYMTGQNGRIYKTIDGAKTWTPNSTMYGFVEGLDFVTKDIGYVRVGNSFHKTIDNGKSWSFVGEISTGIFSQAAVLKFDFIDENLGYAITNNNIFYKTTDGGVTWKKVKSFNSDVKTMNVLNDQTIYLSVDKDVMKSVDGGQTWELSSTNYNFYKIQFLNENVAYACSYDNNLYDGKYRYNLYKTIDGGYKWSVVFSSDSNILSMNFSDVDNGYIGGDMGMMYKTEDGGLNWQKIAVPYGSLEEIKFLNKNVGYFFNSYDYLYKTENGGITWEEDIHFGGRPWTRSSINIVDKDIYLAGGVGKIMRSQVYFKPYHLELYPPKDVRNTSANLSGTVVSNDGEVRNITIQVFSKNSFVRSIEVDPNKVNAVSSLNFTVSLENLNPDTVYQYRIVAFHDSYMIYSNMLSFKTEKNFTIAINPVSNVYPASAVVSGAIQSYEDDISDVEFEYSVKSDFSDYKSLKLNTIVKGNTTENISETLQDLMPKTQYYVRIKASQNGVKIYSEPTFFVTPADFEIYYYTPDTSGPNVILNAFLISNNKDITNIVFEYGLMNFDQNVSGRPEVVLSGASSLVYGNLGALDRTKVYFYRVKALHDGKTIYGETQILNFTNSVVLLSETVLKNENNTFELKGIVNAGGNLITNLQYEYGPTESMGSYVLINPPYIYGSSTVPVNAVLENLASNQVYYYRIIGTVSGSGAVYSKTATFTTRNLGIDEFSKKDNVFLYPNPTNGAIKIEANENKRITSLNVIDPAGKVIFHQNDKNLVNLKEIDLSGKPTGVYFIQIILDNRVEVNKKVILK